MRTCLLLSVLAALCVFIGCDDDVRKDGEVAARESSEMRAAVSAERQGDFDKAIYLYERVAELYPGAALPRLQLASLLHEYRKDYIGAIYNYRRYIDVFSEQLRLANKTNSNARITGISNRIEKVEQFLSAEFIAKLPDREFSPEETQAVIDNIVTMTNRLAALNIEKSALVSSNETLAAELRRLNTRYERLGATLEKLKTSVGSGGAGSASRRSNGLGLEYEGLDTYEVIPGDSLSQIARLKYGDANLWPLIANANSNKVDSAGRVRVGTILVIPPAPEEDE